MRKIKIRTDWIRLPMKVFREPYNLSPVEACVLAVLLDSVDYNDPTGIYYTDKNSATDIARDIGTSKRTVLRALQNIEEKGLIIADTESGKKNTYIIDNKIIKPKGE